jgi:hypothetical protein
MQKGTVQVVGIIYNDRDRNDSELKKNDTSKYNIHSADRNREETGTQ